MFKAIWEWVKSLFHGKGAMQIGKGNQSVSGSSTGAHSLVISAGRDVHFTLPGKASSAHATQEVDLLDWLQKNCFREPLSHVLPQLVRLAQIIGNEDVEHWARLELFGYTREGGMKNDEIVPEYRTVVGQYYDHFNRPLQLPAKLQFVNSYRLRYGAATLEEFAKQNDMQNIGDMGMIELIREELNVSVARFCFSPLSVVDVVNAIRNKAMDKVRELEKQLPKAEKEII